jgi:hypothetical protein
MWAKSRSGILPESHPYEDLQHTIASMTGASVPALVSWIIGFFNGAVILGFVFSRSYKAPGEGHALKRRGVWRVGVGRHGIGILSAGRRRPVCVGRRAGLAACTPIAGHGARLQHHSVGDLYRPDQASVVDGVIDADTAHPFPRARLPSRAGPRFRHFRDMRRLRIQVSLRGRSGHAADTAEGPSLTDAVEKGFLGWSPSNIDSDEHRTRKIDSRTLRP